MESSLDQEVRSLAADRCEYCHIPEEPEGLRHVLDHVIARQHGGETSVANLVLCCGRCNRSKGPNIAGIDPDTGQLTRLFHPRQDRWQDHFRWEGPALVGRTAIGRTTIVVLAINLPIRVAARGALLDEGAAFD